MSSGLRDDPSAAYDSADYANWSLEDWQQTEDDYGDGGSEWCEAGRRESAIKVFQTCVFAAIFLSGVAGNVLVMSTFAAYRRRRRSATDAFLFQLALADLLLLLTLPLQAADTNVGWIFSAPACKAVRAVYAVSTYSGLLLLACIGVERYLAVVRSRRTARRRCRSPAVGRAAAATVWPAATLFGLPEIFYSGVSGSGADAYCGTLGGADVKTAADGTVIGVFALSFLVMAVCYSGIARVLRAGSGGAKRWRRRRTLKLMLALVLLFLLFQLPHSVVLSVKMARPLCALLPEYVTRTLAYARCCLNPVMYALVGQRFRGDVLELLGARRPGDRAGGASVSPPAPM
ncbi:C-C chemokine receptor type 10 [Phyllopteryx taeniolatus]|uniref:C-C chemokine receptor type 10 n=1 Tax=Phyllopteryx taeniolatus TaxID=161469 RepID=UPI002AD52DE3|nr:C-C chemokine receptor type 10 [Phyllopteryx taeniolatus]